VNAVLKALEERKPTDRAISPMSFVPPESSSVAKASFQFDKYAIGVIPITVRKRVANVDRETPESRASADLQHGSCSVKNTGARRPADLPGYE
jgi:hypothetical protein